MENALKTSSVEIKGKAKDGKVKVVKYDRSFLSRIIQNQKAKGFYNDIKNYCLSFEKSKLRSAWGAESFFVGSEAVVKLVMIADVLCVCLSLDPNAYNQDLFPHKDYGGKREFASTPMMVPIRNAAEYKIARRLVGDAFSSRCVYTMDSFVRTDYVSALSMQKDEALVKQSLIRKSESEVSEADAKKMLAIALHADAEEEKELEGLGVKKPKKEPKSKVAKADEGEETPIDTPQDASVDTVTEEAASTVETPSAEETVPESEEVVAEDSLEESFDIVEENAPIGEVSAEGAAPAEEPKTEEIPIEKEVASEGSPVIEEEIAQAEALSPIEESVPTDEIVSEEEIAPVEESDTAEELPAEEGVVACESTAEKDVAPEVSAQPIEENVENAEQAEEEDVVFELAEGDEEEDTVFELAEDGLVIEVRFDRSFIARIIQNERAKAYYSEIKNYALSFGLKPRLSWKADSFYLGRKTYLLAKVRGKTLCLYLALDPQSYEESIYHHRDVSEKKSYEKTPMMLRVRSDLGLRKAKNLISEMLTLAGLEEKETEHVDYVALYPYEETETLIEKSLIKRVERKLDREESERVIESGQLCQSEEPEEVVFELAEEEEEPLAEEEESSIEEAPIAEEEIPAAEVEVPVEEETPVVEEPIAEESEESEPQEEIEPSEEGALATENEEEDDVEDVTFELAEELPVDTDGDMESYGSAAREGRYVTLRKYVRGFTAKMRQGDQERKEYYAAIKSRLLSCQGVKVSESFSGDTFKKGAKALLKSRIRGKTLCLFFALDTDSYKQTVYRQQYKGDTKAYAATPMMVRVKSEQGLKRALRLIDDLKAQYALQEGEIVGMLDIRKAYLYEETSALVAEGLIKTRLVTVTQYEAEELLKRKAK